MFTSTSTAADGICLMLNTRDETERDQLTREWRDHKLEELNFVGTVVSALAIIIFLQFLISLHPREHSSPLV